MAISRASTNGAAQRPAICPAAGSKFWRSRALMAGPKLLLPGEPSLGLAPSLADEIFAIIAALNRAGVGILIVGRNAVATLDVADHAYLIENGRVFVSGTAAALKNNPDIQAFYPGGAGVKDYAQAKHYRRRKRWLS